MNYVTSLRPSRGFNAIWVIVDRLTKTARFIPIKETWPIIRLAEEFTRQIVRIQGVPRTIITLRFWQQVHAALSTSLQFTTAYHSQTDGQSERTIQTLEDMLQVCVLDWGQVWLYHLPLVELSYNNSWHASIKVAPYEALYGQR